MTTMTLPSVQPVTKPAAGKPATGSDNAENGSFQDVLAGQVNKTRPADRTRADAGEQPAGRRPDPAETRPDAGQTAEQVPVQEERQEIFVADLGMAGTEPALPLIAGLMDAGAALAARTAVRADAPADAASPRTADARQPQGLVVPQTAADEHASGDVIADAGTGTARKAALARHQDIAAAAEPTDRRELVTATPAAADRSAARAGDAAPADFARLLAGREAPAPAVPPPAAAMQSAATNAGVAASSHVIEPRLGSRDWSQAVSQKVVWMVGAREQSATLTLNPPDLGPLQVVIQVHNDQADAAFMSDNPEVRQALQDSLGTLRHMMNGAGIQLGDTSVSAGNPGQEQLQQQFQQAQRETGAQGRAQQGDAGARQTQMETPVRRHGGGSGLVDTFA